MRAAACRRRTTTSPTYLRKLGKPTVLAANKAEGMTEGVQLTEFYELGLGEVHPVSAAHGQGIRSLVELAFEPLNLPDEDEEGEAAGQPASSSWPSPAVPTSASPP